MEIPKTNRPDYVDKEAWARVPATLRLRRVTYRYPTRNGMEESVLHTTLLDRAVPACEIVAKYALRWDIEISIREIKALMGVGVLRSKSVDMAHKELHMALSAYNLVRKILSQSADEVGFSPQDGVFQKCVAFGRAVLLDKKGRVFHRWSPGRNGYAHEPNKPTRDPAPEREAKTLPARNKNKIKKTANNMGMLVTLLHTGVWKWRAHVPVRRTNTVSTQNTRPKRPSTGRRHATDGDVRPPCGLG